MGLSEVALGGDGIAGYKLSGINAFADDALNALISRERARDTGRKAPGDSESLFARRHRMHLPRMNDIVS
jgi:hypothetical protein